MHEAGYTFSGESSFYNLTMDEIETLKEGFNVKQQRKAQAQGQSPEEAKEHARKNRMKQGSKARARERFKENRVNN